MTRRQLLFVTLAGLACFLVSTTTANAVTRAELKEHFKQRYPAILRAKDAGKIGETYKGFIEAVKPGEVDGAIRNLIDEENNDRRELYRMIAEDEKSTPEKVAEVNAERSFDRAAKGHYLMHRDGTWKKKQ